MLPTDTLTAEGIRDILCWHQLCRLRVCRGGGVRSGPTLPWCQAQWLGATLDDEATAHRGHATRVMSAAFSDTRIALREASSQPR